MPKTNPSCIAPTNILDESERILLPEAKGYLVYLRSPLARVDGFAAEAWTLARLLPRELENLAALPISDWQPPTGPIAAYETDKDGETVVAKSTAHLPPSLKNTLFRITPLICAVPLPTTGDGDQQHPPIHLELEQAYAHLTTGRTAPSQAICTFDTPRSNPTCAWLMPQPLADYLTATHLALVRVFRIGPKPNPKELTSEPRRSISKYRTTIRWPTIQEQPEVLTGVDLIFPEDL